MQSEGVQRRSRKECNGAVGRSATALRKGAKARNEGAAKLRHEHGRTESKCVRTERQNAELHSRRNAQLQKGALVGTRNDSR